MAKQLSGADAVAVLMAMSRIEGWRSPARVTLQFEQVTALAQAVPVLEVKIPWGPPFATNVGARLVDELDRSRQKLSV